MARPTKQGIDYYSVDVDFDSSLEIILAKYGEKGLGIIVRIWQHIYKTKGYYIPFVEDELYMIKRKCNDTSIEEIKEIIQAMLDKNLFNKEIFDNFDVLTSKRLQMNYKVATRKRVSDGSNLLYWIVSGGSNPVKSTQSKLNKSKLNKSKEIPFVEIDNEEKNKVVKNGIPYQEILDYLNLKTKKRYRDTETTRKYIRARWNNDKMRLDDFYKCIDNSFTFRMKQGGDMAFMKPSTIFNGEMEARVSGDLYNFKLPPKGKNLIDKDVDVEWLPDYLENVDKEKINQEPFTIKDYQAYADFKGISLEEAMKVKIETIKKEVKNGN